MPANVSPEPNVPVPLIPGKAKQRPARFDNAPLRALEHDSGAEWSGCVLRHAALRAGQTAIAACVI